MTIVGQVEIDAFCRRVLAKHWPTVPRHDDVRTCVEWWRSVRRPRVGCVTAGFPCQPSSVAGRRRGDDDDRWLWPEARSVIEALRPEWVVLENPDGILSVRLPRRDGNVGEAAAGVRGAGAVLADLAALGYDTQWDCVSAAGVGAPHLRRRWFCIARLADAGSTRHRQNTGVLPEDAAGDARGAANIGELAGGRGEDVADAAGVGCISRRGGDCRSPERDEGDGEPTRSSETVADAGGPARRPETWDAVAGTRGTPAGIGAVEPGRRGDARARFGRPWPAPERDGWWSPQSGVGESPDGLPTGLDRGVAAPWERGVSRVAANVPNRGDRLRGLGNAVVPQVAEHVARILLAMAEATR